MSNHPRSFLPTPLRASLRLSLAVALLAACSSGPAASSGTAAGAAPKSAPDTTATRVEVAVVEPSQPTSYIVRPGEVKGAREAALASALGGFVERVLVDTGQAVAKGAPIAYIDASIHAAEAELTQVELDDAARELARLERLGSAIPSSRIDAAKTRVARATAQQALSRARQSRAVIRAPFAGVVVDLAVELGEVASPGAPIARLIQLEPAHVEVSIADRDVSLLTVGDTALVASAGAGDQLTGIVSRIELAADLRTRTFMVEVEVPNPGQGLLPGMIAKVRFASRRAGEGVLLPQDFVVTRLDGNGVFTVDAEAIAHWRPVELGAIVGTQVEVLAGLAAGDRIVVLGHRGLAEGDRVIVVREGGCCRDGRVSYARTARLDERPPLVGEAAAPSELVEATP